MVAYGKANCVTRRKKYGEDFLNIKLISFTTFEISTPPEDIYYF